MADNNWAIGTRNDRFEVEASASTTSVRIGTAFTQDIGSQATRRRVLGSAGSTNLLPNDERLRKAISSPSAGFRLMPLPVSPRLRNVVMETYPGLNGNNARSLALRRMMQNVLFGTFYDENTGHRVLPHTTVATLVGVHPKNHGFSAQRWIEEFSREVLPLNCTEYAYTQGLARTINPDIDSAVLAAIREEISGGEEGGVQVWFDSGEAVSRRNKNEAWQTYEEYLCSLSRSSTEADHPARNLILHLSDQPQKKVIQILKSNFPFVKEAVLRLPMNTKTEQATREWCERLLPSLGQFHGMYYTCSDKTPRIFATGANVHQLPRDIRKVAFGGCVECDLRAAQLAVVAKLWGIAPLQEFLAGRESIWETLASHLGVPSQAYKPILKRTVYSIVFGMGRKNLLAQLTDGTVREEGVGAVASKLFSHPLMEALLLARTQAMRKARVARGCYDAWGKWVGVPLEWDKKRERRLPNVRSVLSQVVQSYELRLMLPLLDVVKREGQIYLLSWLHDGVTLHFGNKTKADRQIKRIVNAVQAEAKVLGMETKLEVQPLPTNQREIIE